MSDFDVGDTVSWAGTVGTITAMGKNTMNVTFEGPAGFWTFYRNGKEYEWHKEASLSIVKKAPKWTEQSSLTCPLEQTCSLTTGRRRDD